MDVRPHEHNTGVYHTGGRSCRHRLARLLLGVFLQTCHAVVLQFTRDFVIQSPNYLTSQENIVLHYLRQSPPDYVIFNSGLHDASFNMTAETYASNLQWLTDMLMTVLPPSQLFFMATTPVRPDLQAAQYRNVTTNKSIYAYNQRALELSIGTGIAFIDLFALLRLPFFQSLYSDGVHQHEQSSMFYQLSSSVVTCVVCGHLRVP